ncbi:hypothetical protein [Acinetobacter phage vB_ApiM_IME-Ap7]
MKYITLKENKRIGYQAPNYSVKPIKKSLPFLEAFRGLYAHRVRFVDLHTNPKGSHFAIKTWCGATFCNGGKDGKGQTYFVETPTNNRPICATCEGRFIGAGMDGDREINGRKVLYMNH